MLGFGLSGLLSGVGSAMQQQTMNPYQQSLQSQAAAFNQAALELAAVRAASPFAGYLNAVRTTVAHLPLDWAEFCERVQDWSTERLLSEVRRLRALR